MTLNESERQRLEIEKVTQILNQSTCATYERVKIEGNKIYFKIKPCIDEDPAWIAKQPQELVFTFTELETAFLNEKFVSMELEHHIVGDEDVGNVTQAVRRPCIITPYLETPFDNPGSKS